MSLENKIILVSVIAYREQHLAESIRNYYETADYPENLRFSVVAEQKFEHLHADLSFIPEDQLVYRKYDLSIYRGVLWSRERTTDVDFQYDFILYTCGHNIFTPSWDTRALLQMDKALKLSNKPVIMNIGAEYRYNSDGTHDYSVSSSNSAVTYRKSIGANYVPGYGFPNEYLTSVPGTDELLPSQYMQFSWVLAPREYVQEVPLDPDINYHAEEIWVSIKTFAAGWDMLHTQELFYYHDTYKMYPGESMSRTISHRPWSDMNKDAFWAQSDETERLLNKLLSGQLNVPIDICLDFCELSGMDPKWFRPIKDYANIGLYRHGEEFRADAPILVD